MGPIHTWSRGSFLSIRFPPPSFLHSHTSTPDNLEFVLQALPGNEKRDSGGMCDYLNLGWVGWVDPRARGRRGFGGFLCLVKASLVSLQPPPPFLRRQESMYE